MFWNRYYAGGYAKRADGIEIRQSADRQSLAVNGGPLTAAASILWDGETVSWVSAIEAAIHVVDTSLAAPGEWSYDSEARKWTRGDWTIQYAEVWGADRVYTPGWTLWGKAVRRTFASADRARHFADLTDGVTARPNRGPKARAGKAASVVLPDVRVTPEEREAATEFAKGLGVSYADMIRAGLTYLRQEVLTEKNVIAVRRHDTGAVAFVDVATVQTENKKSTIIENDAIVPVTVL